MIMSLTFINTMTGAWWVRLLRRDSSDTLEDVNDIFVGCKDIIEALNFKEQLVPSWEAWFAAHQTPPSL